MTNPEIQNLIDRVNNLSRIRTAIEVIRELEMYNHVYPEYYNDEHGASPTFYLMYKDLHAVERILLNKYGDDLGTVYWNIYKYIQNTVQSFIFENIFDLRRLQKALEDLSVLEPTAQYSEQRWFREVNFIEKRESILISFKTMLDWVDGQIEKHRYPMEREAYDPEFKPS